MARTYARVKTGIWADDDFRSLPLEAQHLYFVLLTSNSLNYCGVTDWRPVRIAAAALGWSAEEVTTAGCILAERHYVVIDESTEEVLIRSFIRNDGFMAQTTVAASMVRAYGQIASSRLRGVVVFELNRLYEKHPEFNGWAAGKDLLQNPAIDPFVAVTDDPACDPISHPLCHPSDDPISHPNADTALTLVVTPLLPTPSPTPSPTPPTGEIDPGRPARKRHIPADWMPHEKHAAKATRLELDLALEVENFRNYDLAKGPVWKDFDAAFTIWLNNAAKWGGSKRNPYGQQEKTDGLFDRAMQRTQAPQQLETS